MAFVSVEKEVSAAAGKDNLVLKKKAVTVASIFERKAVLKVTWKNK